MFKIGDTVRVLPNKKVGIVTDISEGFVILDDNQARPYFPQQLELVLKKFVLLERGTVMTKRMFEEQKKVDDWFATRLFIKTSDNILDLVEVGDLVEINEMSGIYYVDSIITDEDGLRVFICDQKYGYWFEFNETEVKAFYKRQTNGDYKRYEVER